MTWLLNEGYLRGGSLLDYGCGKGTDIRILNELDVRHPNFRYDPNNHHFDEMPEGQFDIVTNFFVLNTIPSAEERYDILCRAQHKLKLNGVLWVAVRNDRKKLNGWTKRGTWQGYVEVSGELVTQDNSFRLYRLDKHSIIDSL
jgi:2-polyprenyl-3-methyl-5-hydroxy-6-metoxy-1,4-benzoquinol methylase